VLIEPGFFEESYRILYYRAGDAPSYFDYATFDNQLWLVLPPQSRMDSGRTVFNMLKVRVLIPSGSSSINVDYIPQVSP